MMMMSFLFSGTFFFSLSFFLSFQVLLCDHLRDKPVRSKIDPLWTLGGRFKIITAPLYQS